MVQLFVNYEKIIFKFVVLSIALARPGTILPVVREITRTKKVCKRIIILGICKMSINIQVCLQCYIVVMFTMLSCSYVFATYVPPLPLLVSITIISYLNGSLYLNVLRVNMTKLAIIKTQPIKQNTVEYGNPNEPASPNDSFPKDTVFSCTIRTKRIIKTIIEPTNKKSKISNCRM